MVYFKNFDENGFISVCTLNAESGGNIDKEEYDTIVDMFKNAEHGYGVKETPQGFVYEKYETDDNISEEEAFAILMGDE